MPEEQIKIKCNIEPAVNVCCLDYTCINNVPGQFVCCLKVITISPTGQKCMAYIKGIPRKQKVKKKKAKKI